MLDILRRIFSPSNMDELYIFFISEDRFKIKYFRQNTQKVIKLSDKAPIFQLEKDGSLPKELFYYLSKTLNIPIEQLSLHCIKIEENEKIEY